ncbi:Protein TIFY 8 [Camellia lanceoleosa]|uniref:Protein TIFY 8 n=1 Tax=Camellia lanceoleosa TaxID=1840588 RepID=A0ACC0HBR7_9ERIC|nr:Protein TIFY 8 [Camellia lanceoleosa]
MRRQIGDLCEGGVGNGGSARVERGSQAGGHNGLSFKSNGLGQDVGSTHEELVSSKNGGLGLLCVPVSQTSKELDPVLNGCSNDVIHVDKSPNNIGPRTSLSDSIEVLGLGSDRVYGFEGEAGLRRCTTMMEMSRSSTCDVFAPAVRHVQGSSSIHGELNTEEVRLGLADMVDRSSGDFQNLNGLENEGIEDLMEVIQASEKQIHEVDEGHFEIHKVLQNLEDYGSSASSESKSEADISEDEQDENVWDLNRFFNEDCTIGGEGIGKVSDALYQVSTSVAQGLSVSSLPGGIQAIPNSSFVRDRDQDGLSVFQQSNSCGPIHEVSLANNIVQGVTAKIPTTTVNESVLVSESLRAHISQGQVNDNQCGIFQNHPDKGGQVFSKRKEETESWLHELSKYETCPIEESEIPHFLQLLQVMGLSLVKMEDTFGPSRMSKRERENNAKNTTDEVKPTIFHNFLGRSYTSDSSSVAAVKSGAGGDGRVSEASLAASTSVSGSSGGGRGPISATSNLGSERQVANHFKRVPFYGFRSDLIGTEMSNRFVGNKQSNSNFAFTRSSKDGFPQAGPKFLDGLHLMKILRNAGEERPRHSHDEAMFFDMHSMRPTLTSRVLQPPTRSRTNATADEGSHTGIKGSRILSSINASSRVSDRNPSGVLLPGSKQKSGTHNSKPESLTSRPSQHGSISSSCQMTIFHGGQAYGFDDVHPNKMSNNKGFDGRRDLIEAYVALQHIVPSMNYTCGVYIVVLHATLERFKTTRKISRNPNPFKQQIDHLNRLIRDNDIDSHEQLQMNRHTFMLLCGLIRIRGMNDATVTSGCRKKGKGKATASLSRNRRVWTPKECDVLIRAMRDLFSEKWKADNVSGTPCNQGGSGTTSKKRAREAKGITKRLAVMAVKKTNTTMEEIAHRFGYAHDLSLARKLVKWGTNQVALNTNDRLRAATLIVKDAKRVDLFFSLPEEDKMEWVCLLLAGYV